MSWGRHESDYRNELARRPNESYISYSHRMVVGHGFNAGMVQALWNMSIKEEMVRRKENAARSRGQSQCPFQAAMEDLIDAMDEREQEPQVKHAVRFYTKGIAEE